MTAKKRQTDTGIPAETPKKGRGRPKSEILMVRKTYHLPVELADKIEVCAYWDRMTISAVLTDALQQYFKGRKLKPIPRNSKKSVEDFY